MSITNMTFRKLALITTVAFVSACASTPDVMPVTKAPEQTAKLPPVSEAPAYIPPTQDTTPYISAPAYEAAPVPGSMEDFIYQSGEDRVYFGYDRFDLDEASRNVLRRQAEWLNTYTQVSAVIAGHADERGTRNYNLALGARRADSVKDYLVSLGVNPRRLTSVSFGKERPIDARSSPDGWAKNRNVHTNLTSGLSNGSVF